jgi:hypothetical protein
VALLVAMSAGRAWAAATVPDDSRLGAARAELQAVVDAAARDALPDGLIIDKIREGLAKGVPAERIVVVARGLGLRLGEARQMVAARFQGPRAGGASPSLVRAIAEARIGGAGDVEVEAVLAHAGEPERAERAVRALSDLIARGFPPAASARAVGVALDRRDPALGRLGVDASSIRKHDGAAPEAALDEASRRHATEEPRAGATLSVEEGAADRAHAARAPIGDGAGGGRGPGQGRN